MAHIRIDSSARTHIALCADCPAWRSAPYDTKIAAQAAGVRHERQTHPREDHALQAQNQRRRRAARG